MMDIKTLKAAFAQKLFLIDMFFHSRLLKDARTRPMLEAYKQDLLVNLFEELVKVHTRGTYQNYDPVKLIFIKAKKVWIDLLRSLEREGRRRKIVNIDDLPDDHTKANLCTELESKNTVALIKKFLNPEDFDLLQYRSMGYTYKQILEVTNHPTENAAKTRFYRVKQLVREHFGRKQ
jgi:hypothetical protein